MGRARGHEYRTLDATSLAAGYGDVGAVLTDECIEYTIHNTSDVDAIISFDDGTTDHAYVVSGGSVSSRASEPNKAKVEIAKGAQIQAKQVTGVGASGDIIVNLTLDG